MEVLVRTVKDENGWLSCMSAYEVEYNGITFRTCEALFQWRRFTGFPDVQKEIFECKSPMGAKMIARKNRFKLNRGEKWDEAPQDLTVMEECLRLKLEQHPELKEKLLLTGNGEIIEDCTTHDRESARFWGKVKKDNKWIGENKLGIIWMKLRDELVTEKEQLDVDKSE